MPHILHMETSSANSNNNGNDGGWMAEEAIAGNAEALQALRELITFPLLYSCESRKLGLKGVAYEFTYCPQWPRGLLLYGPSGTGKTSRVRAVVRECGAHLTVIRKEQDIRVASQLFMLMDSNKLTLIKICGTCCCGGIY